MCLLLAAVAALLIVHAARHQTTTVIPRSADHGLAALQRLPMQAQGVISTSVGASQAGFDAHLSATGYRLSGGGVTVNVQRGGALVNVAAAGSLWLSAPGASSAKPTARGNHVLLAAAGAHEWYANGPLGIEQGFIVARRLSGAAGSLTLSETFAGSLRPRRTTTGLAFTTPSGRAALLYGGLAATDATGRSLAASFALRRRTILLRVDARGARFPLRIDPFIEQQKIVPADLAGPFSNFGFSVATSADGTTALIGATSDGSAQDGAAWVYTRSGSTWTEQKKIVPTDQIGQAAFGSSVALSANGNTALIGGESDGSAEQGAVWVYTRSGTTWTEVQKIVPPDETIVGSDPLDAQVGRAVALSADGKLALLGGPGDNGTAAWVYTRSGSRWTEQKKIVARDEIASSFFGDAVALSSSGRTALIGGPNDGKNFNKGAAWVYVHSKTGWSEQKKLIPKHETANVSNFGTSAALSSAGNIALIGGSGDGRGKGAAWVFSRAGTKWSEQKKIVPGHAKGASEFGASVSLSPSGTTALIGGPGDAAGKGAAWVFSRAGTKWSEQQKLVPTDEKGGNSSSFGTSVALAIASTAVIALIGGNADDSHEGAAWVYSGRA